MSQEVYLIDGIRSAIGNFGGSLAALRADDLAAQVLAGLLERHPNLDPKSIEDVLLGCANQAGEDNRNVARMASLLAGYPIEVPGETVNRLCASGLAAAVNATRALRNGEGNVYVAGGVEQIAPYADDRGLARRVLRPVGVVVVGQLVPEVGIALEELAEVLVQFRMVDQVLAQPGERRHLVEGAVEHQGRPLCGHVDVAGEILFIRLRKAALDFRRGIMRQLVDVPQRNQAAAEQ